MTLSILDKTVRRAALSEVAGLAFAAIWATRGATALHWSPEFFLPPILAISLSLAWGFLLRDPAQWQTGAMHDRKRARQMRRLRFILIFALGMTLSMMHRPDLTMTAAGLIIGASYIPVGRATSNPVQSQTGVVIIGITLIALLFPEPLHGAVAGFGTAAALWMGSLRRLQSAAEPGGQASPDFDAVVASASE